MNRFANLRRSGLFLLATFILPVSMPSRAWCSSAGFLWVGLYDNDACNAADDTCSGIQQFSPSQLKKNGGPSPVAGVTTFDDVEGNAFDAKHNLWELVYDDQSGLFKLVEFTAAELKKLKSKPNPTPAVVITSGTFNFPDGIAFDPNGNLCVADPSAEEVYEFSAAQLASSGAKTPKVVNSSSDLSEPEFPVFDKNGNLWLSNYSNHTLVRFTQNQLTGNQNPGVIIGDDGSNSIDHPGQLAFDPQGNLWIANSLQSNVEEFTTAQIASSGNPTPMVKLSSNKNSLDSPWGLTFIGGNLVVGNYNSGTIVKFVASQLHASGSPTPQAFLTSSAIPVQNINQLTAGPKF